MAPAPRDRPPAPAGEARPAAALLLLADSRLPAGGHAHSGGIEAAIAAGLVTGLAELEPYLRGRLATAGAQAAAVAAHACRLSGSSGRSGPSASSGVMSRPSGASSRDCPPPPDWLRLDAEVSARMPSPAQRAASRSQGRGLLRVAARCWPDPALRALGARPHHSVVLGVAVALSGGQPHDAALIAASASVTGPASAALRLLGLDPVELTELLARLGPEVDRCAAYATTAGAVEDPSALPAPAGPLLDILAEQHAQSEVKLFAS